MRGNRRVVTIVVVVIALGFGVGYLPYLPAVADLTAPEDGVSINDAMRTVMLVGAGLFLAALVAAYLIAASRSAWRGWGLVSLILGTTAAVMLGSAIGAALHDGERAGWEWAAFVLVVVAIGATIGYGAGRPPQQESRHDE